VRGRGLSRYAGRVRGAVGLLVAVTIFSGSALAEDLAIARPGKQWCSIDWEPGQLIRLAIDLRVTRRQLVSLDEWVQVAPGGHFLAVRTESSELHVFNSSGPEIWHRAGVSAFRFSPSGDRLAVASRQGVDVIMLAHPEPRRLSSMGRVDALHWIDGGLLARAGQRLFHLDEAGQQRAMATLPKDALLTSSLKRAVFFSHGATTDLDLSGGRPGPARKLPVRARVLNADLPPDGSKVLFATEEGTYLLEGQSAPTKLADDAALSLSFSPDGSAYLWVGPTTGSLVSKGKAIALPDDTIGARFRQDDGADLVLTVRPGRIVTWNPATGRRQILGGISPDDGSNFAGDIAGGAAVAFFCKKSAGVKEHSIPSADEELFQ
jgi:hypothetical protein